MDTSGGGVISISWAQETTAVALYDWGGGVLIIAGVGHERSEVRKRDCL